jgi:hypothetical protein
MTLSSLSPSALAWDWMVLLPALAAVYYLRSKTVYANGGSGAPKVGAESEETRNIRTSENYPSRDCLESSRTGRIARLSVARSAEKGALSPVVQAHGTIKWSPFGVSRQSLHALR